MKATPRQFSSPPQNEVCSYACAAAGNRARRRTGHCCCCSWSNRFDQHPVAKFPFFLFFSFFSSWSLVINFDMIGEKIPVFFSSRCSATSRENIMTGTRWADCSAWSLTFPDRIGPFLFFIRYGCVHSCTGGAQKGSISCAGSIINLFSQPKKFPFFFLLEFLLFLLFYLRGESACVYMRNSSRRRQPFINSRCMISSTWILFLSDV